MNIQRFIDESKRIKPYQPGPPIEQLAQGLGVDETDILKLNSNENLFLDKQFIQGLLGEAVLETDPRLYPQAEETLLKEKIADLNGVDPGQVVVSAGGDQIIEVLFNLLPKDEPVTTVTPTFSMYPRAALQRGITLRRASLGTDFSINIPETLGAARGSSMLIVCSPNNPTGNQFPLETLLELVSGFDGLVLIDEAYMEYSDYSMAEYTKDYENLIILRTFSKAYGLAGLRLGYLVTNPELAETIRTRYMMPYPVPNIILRTGYKILSQNKPVMESVEETKTQRDWLTKKLQTLDKVSAYTSKANFVLFNTEQPYSMVSDALTSRGIILSKQGNILGQENCLRVTVAPRPLLNRFLDALEEATN